MFVPLMFKVTFCDLECDNSYILLCIVCISFILLGSKKYNNM